VIIIDVEVLGEALAIKRILDLRGEYGDRAEGAVQSVAEWAAGAAGAGAPTASGQLAGSYAWRYEPVGGDPRARVGTGEPYGRRVEFGFAGQFDSLGRGPYRDISLPVRHLSPVADQVPARLAKALRG
jgi:hypothetical protein